jgi:hypothetical protein
MTRAAYYRLWRAARKAAGVKDVRHRAEYFRMYRSTRLRAQRPLRERTIVAWDGEGVRDRVGMDVGLLSDLEVTDSYGQRYILLANSAGGRLIDRAGISTAAALAFLCDEAERLGSNVYHCGYSIEYDVAMIVRDLPQAVRARLVTEGRVRWIAPDGRHYAITYIRRKLFRVARAAVGRTVGSPWTTDVCMTLRDLWPYCQCSFVAALERFGIQADVDSMAVMKSRRDEFMDADLDGIVAYNEHETAAMVSLARAIEASHARAGLNMGARLGPGSSAAALLRRRGVVPHADVWPAVRPAVATAFYGGRIESLCVGTSSATLYAYDMTSAYPAALCVLPDFTNVRFRHVDGDTDAPWALAHVRWDLRDVTADWRRVRFGPLPVRRVTGSVGFPLYGEGWVFSPERRMLDLYAEAMGFSNRFYHVVQSWDLVPSSDRNPFAWVADVFRDRPSKDVDPGGNVVVKLALNALYGKLAQQVGYRDDRTPAFFAPLYSGLITSIVRARLLAAALCDPGSIVAFCTDGIISRHRLPIETEPGLGAWTCEPSPGGIVVGAGLYWLFSGRPKTRGVSFRLRSQEAPEFYRCVSAAWAKGQRTLEWPVVAFLSSLHTAHLSAQADDLRCSWLRVQRTIAIDGTSSKRDPVKDVRRLSEHLVSTRVREDAREDIPFEPLVVADPQAATRGWLAGLSNRAVPLQFACWPALGVPGRPTTMYDLLSTLDEDEPAGLT